MQPSPSFFALRAMYAFTALRIPYFFVLAFWAGGFNFTPAFGHAVYGFTASAFKIVTFLTTLPAHFPKLYFIYQLLFEPHVGIIFAPALFDVF